LHTCLYYDRIKAMCVEAVVLMRRLYVSMSKGKNKGKAAPVLN